MTSVVKKALAIVAIAFVALCVVVGVPFFKAMQAFAIENRIHSVFYPVSVALENFTETNGVPPANLTQLVPTFLKSVPTTPLVDKVEYRVVDGTNWIMEAHSKALKPDRVYTWRCGWDWQLTPQEKSRILKRFHNIVVLKE